MLRAAATRQVFIGTSADAELEANTAVAQVVVRVGGVAPAHHTWQPPHASSLARLPQRAARARHLQARFARGSSTHSGHVRKGHVFPPSRGFPPNKCFAAKGLKWIEEFLPPDDYDGHNSLLKWPSLERQCSPNHPCVTNTARLALGHSPFSGKAAEPLGSLPEAG